jgi:hypothetical protein
MLEQAGTLRRVSEASCVALLTACLATAALACGCADVPKVIRELPELPVESARDLAFARTAPVLLTKPGAPAPGALPHRAPLSAPLAPARACTSVSEGYVTYPIAVCYPPTVQVGSLVLESSAPASPAPPGSIGILPVHYFKLSSPAGASSLLPWFCTVRAGPWYARVQGAQICNADPNIRVFTAEILGAPEPVSVTWTGTLADPPPPPLRLVSVSQTSEFCSCCSGITCPDGTCKLNSNQCGTAPPPPR